MIRILKWRYKMTRYATAKRKSNLIITERKEGRTNTSIVLDVSKCTGCNLCWTVCPRYAIERGPIGASIRQRVKEPPIRINYYKCVFCGLCAFICPFDALTLQINGKSAEKIKQGVSLPYLKGHKVLCSKNDNTALKFIEGKIEVNDDLCPGGCSTCIEICPVECLSLPVATKEEPWEKTAKVGVNRDKCLYCGACLFACPTGGAINLERTKISCSEEGSDSRIWQNIEQKLKKPVASRDWFYEERVKASPGGETKSAPKRKDLKG
ncbi:MAG: 4Fe-4S dicluster domain-containing protein [Asgard group archaeon]|nr:4Fe-4S dicluster domain-containing protein [Asgard group archaeon]